MNVLSRRKNLYIHEETSTAFACCRGKHEGNAFGKGEVCADVRWTPEKVEALTSVQQRKVGRYVRADTSPFPVSVSQLAGGCLSLFQIADRPSDPVPSRRDFFSFVVLYIHTYAETLIIKRCFYALIACGPACVLVHTYVHSTLFCSPPPLAPFFPCPRGYFPSFPAGYQGQQ